MCVHRTFAWLSTQLCSLLAGIEVVLLQWLNGDLGEDQIIFCDVGGRLIDKQRDKMILGKIEPALKKVFIGTTV